MWWSHLPVAFVKDITVALAAAPVSSSVSTIGLVVNRPRVLQLGKPTGDLLLGREKWAEFTHLHLWEQWSPQELVECLCSPGVLFCTGDGEE